MTHKIRINHSKLRRALAASAVCVSRDDSRLALNSIRFDMRKGNLRLVSTDGHRMMFVDAALGLDTDLVPCDFLVSLYHIGRLLNISRPIKGSPEQVTIEWVPSEVAVAKDELEPPGTVLIKIDCVTFGIRCVNAVFPPYREVIPKSHKVDSKGRLLIDPVIGLDYRYLGDIQKIGKNICGIGQGAKVTVGATSLDPVRFDFANQQEQIEATLILMPMRM